MGQWVVTVAGIAIISVLCDVILPEGQTRKYIKTVIGIVVTLVMIRPLINLFNGSSFSSDTNSDTSVSIQQSYLDMVEDKQVDLQSVKVKNILNARGISVQSVVVTKESRSLQIQATGKENDVECNEIIDVAQTYFDGYEIIIKWSEYE